jgi:hypothetical protein
MAAPPVNVVIYCPQQEPFQNDQGQPMNTSTPKIEPPSSEANNSSETNNSAPQAPQHVPKQIVNRPIISAFKGPYKLKRVFKVMV